MSGEGVAIGAAGGSFLGPPGALIGAGIGAFTDFIGGQSSAKENKILQKNAYLYARQMRQSQYQDTVKDMRKAGINPMMLAAGGALSQGMSTASGTAGQVGEGIQKAGSRFSEGLMMKAQLQQMASATQLNQSLNEKTIQEAAKIHTETYSEGLRGSILSQQEAVEGMRLTTLIEGMVKNNMLSQAQAEEIYADMNLNRYRKDVMQAQAAQGYSAANLNRANLGAAEWKSSIPGILSQEGKDWAGVVLDAFGKARGRTLGDPDIKRTYQRKGGK